MQPLEAVMEARKLLSQVTPLKRDCGRYCGGACCEPDEDGQGGMLLFPVLLVTLQQLNDRGLVRLWKSI